jgi:tetratricopeptide (TPR) repeat protein
MERSHLKNANSKRTGLKLTMKRIAVRSQPFTRLRLLRRALFFAVVAAYTVGAQQSQGDFAKVQAAFDAGNAFLNRGQAQAAVEKYSEAIAINGSFPLPYINRGIAYATLSRNAEALADAEKALSLLAPGTFPATHSGLAHQVKGIVYQNQGNHKLALESFSKAIELDPGSAKYFNARGVVYRLLNEFDLALADYNKAISLDPTIPHTFVNRASVYLKRKDHAAALKDLDEAIRLDKSIDTAYNNRANTYIEIKDYEKALTDYSQAILLNPKSAYYYGRGRLHILQGRYESGVSDNTEAIRLDPANPNAYLNRAVAYSRSNKFALALADIRKASELKPESVHIRYNLAYVLYRQGEYSAAIGEANKVMAAAPKWDAPYKLRANAYAKLGNAAKAKADSETAARLGPGNPPVEDIFIFSLDLMMSEETKP